MLPNLKILRKKAGISQQKLADALGINQQSINQYENHLIEPDISLLCDMANYFHTSIDYIVGRVDKNKPDTVSMDLKLNEADFIEKYRALKPAEQRCVDTVLNTLLDKD